ncbi:NTP transferase domain-containing protein [Companilactobacillus jidongensis]|uniref:NTP transferase domain-containing protein n=1 Tax=Companilactobacillus jidongensis TaxID=2486006 RepID=UPI000F77563D|nr:NTP transferase domain-containing protein [Companilactobacillus jidongensis]
MTDSLILAGGKSTRFQTDKALAHFNNKYIPNVQYTADLTPPFVDNCYISTNQNNNLAIDNLFTDTKIQVIPDVEPMIDCGPLSALWSYFYTTRVEQADLLVIATDYIIDQKTIEFLSEDSGYIKIKSLPYYTCCHLMIKIDLLKQHIDKHDYRWRSLLVDANCIARDYEGNLKNINYPEDLE